MPVVQIEHPIRDFETWKATFDRDPIGREASGVRRYEIYRPVDDPNYVAVDLEIDSRAEAVKASFLCASVVFMIPSPACASRHSPIGDGRFTAKAAEMSWTPARPSLPRLEPRCIRGRDVSRPSRP